MIVLTWLTSQLAVTEGWQVAQSGDSRASSSIIQVPSTSQLLTPIGGRNSLVEAIQDATDKQVAFESAKGESSSRDASSMTIAKSIIADTVAAAAANVLANNLTANKQPEPAASISPSPLDKILDSIQSINSSSGGENNNSNKLASVALHMLKPRKFGQSEAGSRSKQMSSAEQQIINQHARMHLAANSHQRLVPTKQRDNKILASVLADSSSSGRDSPLQTLLGSFKSGISSRSSIVKAISDNKLARSKYNSRINQLQSRIVTPD